ncbi:MAG: alpha-amylase family glycosyl hydrolase [Faecalibacterium prausnitzii]
MVDRRLGTNAEFKDFCGPACHARGQQVIVDGVFNHVGRDFFAFQDLKANRENARYKDWFCDVNFWGNNEYNDGFSYGNWGGFNLLVKLNQRNPEVQNYHYDTIRFWVDEFDIDGIRLDAADVLDFRLHARSAPPCQRGKARVLADGRGHPRRLQPLGKPGDAAPVTNYELHKGLWSGHNDHNYFEIAHTMRRLQGLCHDTRLYLFSDNHDVERLPNKLRNRDHIRHIALLVYTLWGIPSIYYGSEFGIEGKKEWGSDWPLRPCLELTDYTDAETHQPCHQRVCRTGQTARRSAGADLRRGKELQLTTQCYAFARVLDGKAPCVGC